MSQDKKNDHNQPAEEKNVGHTRKSAASAKPKSKAAASVTIKKSTKTPEQKKAAQKQARAEARAERKRIDRMYYNPDTERYKKLRRLWWGSLIGAVVSTAISWVTRNMEPTGISMFFMLLAYALIIAAFYLDFSKIRKERQAYQERMLALEGKKKKEEKAAARAARAAEKAAAGDKKKGK